MNIYEKIDTIFSGYGDDRPIWANEILEELNEIKTLLKNTNNTVNKIDKNYYEFVKDFRQMMKADVEKGLYPKVKYQDKVLGINFKGHLYDTSDNSTLPKDEAFSAYEYFYENQKNLYIYK